MHLLKIDLDGETYAELSRRATTAGVSVDAVVSHRLARALDRAAREDAFEHVMNRIRESKPVGSDGVLDWLRMQARSVLLSQQPKAQPYARAIVGFAQYVFELERTGEIPPIPQAPATNWWRNIFMEKKRKPEENRTEYLAKKYGLSRQHLSRLARQGKIRATRIVPYGPYQYDESSIKEYLQLRKLN